MGQPFAVTALAHERPERNPVRFWRERVLEAAANSQFVVLPEACDRPRGMSSAEYRLHGEELGGEFLRALPCLAREAGVWIAACARRNARNTMVMVDAAGREVYTYCKTFLYPDEADLEGIQCGAGAGVAQTALGCMGAIICFDINFVELREQYARLQPQCMLFASLFDGGGMRAEWARGIGCHMICAAAGKRAAIFSPMGETLAESMQSVSAKINIDCAVVHLDYNREKLARLERERHVTIRIKPENGTALITGLDENQTVSQMLSDYQINTARAYFDWCRARQNPLLS